MCFQGVENMASIKSDLTNKSYPAGRKMREFEVSDESESEELYDYSQDSGPPVDPQNIEAINARLASRGLPPLDETPRRPAAPVAPARNYNDAETLNNLENKVAQARKLKASGKERLSTGAKRRVEILCDMFKNHTDVDIDGQLFVLRTLKGKEMKEALIAASEFNGTVALPFETRKYLLSYSLVQIAGTEVEMFLGEDSIEARMEFLEELDDSILNRLYGAYVDLVNETNAKYAIKNEADAKEVAADLKK